MSGTDDEFDLAMQNFRGAMQGRASEEEEKRARERLARGAAAIPGILDWGRDRPRVDQNGNLVVERANLELVPYIGGSSKEVRTRITEILQSHNIPATAQLINELGEAGDFSELSYAVSMLRRRGCTCVRPMFPGAHPGVKLTIQRTIDMPIYRHWAKCIACSVNVFFERAFQP